jgi:hypothetical protein
MNWEALGAISETIGALGVIGTLVYLAVQIRHNTRSLRASTYQAVLDSARSDNKLVLVHPHLERVYRVGRRDPTALTEEERPLFRLLIAQFFQNHEMLFLQHQEGVISDDLWERRQIGLQMLASQPGVRQWWSGGTVRELFDSRFQELVDSLVDKVTGQDEPAA